VIEKIFAICMLVTSGVAFCVEIAFASMDGIGQIRIGMNVAAVERIVGRLPAVETQQESTRGCRYVQPTYRKDLALMFVDGQLARIDVLLPGVRIREDVQVGSKVEQLSGFRKESHAYDSRGYYLTTIDWQRHRGIRLEIVAGKVMKYSVGRDEEVQWEENCL